MEQRTLKIGDRVLYCYEDGSIEYLSRAHQYREHPLVRTKGTTDGRRYNTIELSVNGKLRKLKIHRLIAAAFHPNPNGLPEVDHINRNTLDNSSSNLRWCDRKTNLENRGCVDKSLAKYGVRCCDDKSSYMKEYNKHRRTIFKTISEHEKS